MILIPDDALEDDDDKLGSSNVGLTSHLMDKDHLTKQERLAVECLKPRLQVTYEFHVLKAV